MKKIIYQVTLSTLITSATFISSQAAAVEGLSANVAATSNYLWRGVSQTNNATAISGGIDYSAKSGFYAGTWASNVDFSDDASYEIDFYLGFGGEFGKGLGYDLGYIYYAYPDSAESDTTNEYDFGELYGTLSYGNFSVTASYGVNNDDGAEWADSALYISGNAEFELADDLILTVHVGNYSFDGDYESDDYSDYGISLSKEGFTFGLSDTNIDNDDINVVVSYSIDISL